MNKDKLSIEAKSIGQKYNQAYKKTDRNTDRQENERKSAT